MKRKLFLILPIMIMCFILSSCNNYIEYDDSEILKNVTMTIKRWNSTVIITDLSDNDNIYGKFFLELIKKTLAIKYPEDRDIYAKGKKDFIDNVVFEALNEITKKRERKDS